MRYPQMYRLRQQFDRTCVRDIAAKVRDDLASLQLASVINLGDRVAITAGSRGITSIDVILRAIVDFVREIGGEPFIVPAMGSHGGATADGQRQVLASFGITPESMGCPIRSSMETVLVCQSDEGVDIHFDRQAYEADHVIVCNRIKLHTDFSGQIQSGLMKMMLIGLGKHIGASIYHRAFRDHSFDEIAKSVSDRVIKQCNVIAGLAIIENGYEQTAMIHAIKPEAISSIEPDLLKQSVLWMPRLPFADIDVLIVDEIGKNISGTGMDTNVVGRKRNENRATAGETPRIGKIVVRDLTDQTHGNATGIGVADFTTQKVIDKMDYAATRVNCVTSGRTAVAMIPIYYPTERESIEAALSTCGLTPPKDARVVWIRNTRELEHLCCSAALLNEIADQADVDIIGDSFAMSFDEHGQLQTEEREIESTAKDTQQKGRRPTQP